MNKKSGLKRNQLLLLKQNLQNNPIELKLNYPLCNSVSKTLFSKGPLFKKIIEFSESI